MLWDSKHSTPQSMGRRIPPSDAEKATSESWKDRFKSGGNRPFSSGRPTLRGILVALVIIGVIGGGLYLGMLYRSQTVVKSVEISGNHFTESDEILSKSGNLMQVHIDSIPYLSIIRNIESLPFVHHAAIQTTPSGRLSIYVEERSPIGHFVQGSRRFYLDREGVSLPIIPGKVVDVPLVYGMSYVASGDTLKTKEFQLIRDFLITAQRHPVASSTLSEIAWTSDEGIVALSHENGIRVVFGSDHFERSLSNWSMFYRQVVAVRGPDNFTAVDLRYGGQIVTRESKTS